VLNAVATRLTIGTTLFVAWTLVTGFFGQNFGWLVDHIKSGHAFLVWGVGGLVVPTIVLLTLFWVKRDDWFLAIRVARRAGRPARSRPQRAITALRATGPQKRLSSEDGRLSPSTK